MYRFTQDAIDLDELRARLRKMTDAELIAFGKAARRMCSRAANLGKPPREPFVIQLREARAEWKRRQTTTLKMAELEAWLNGSVGSPRDVAMR
jgi:hypothetical protein